MADLAGSLATETLKACIGNSVKSVYSSIKNYKSNLKLFHDNLQILRAKKEDIDRKVEVGEMVLHEVTKEASVWLKSVEALLDDEEVKELMNDELRRVKDQCCFGLFLCNLYHRYGMGRLAKSKVEEIKEKLGQLPQDPVTVPKTNMDLDPIPSQHCKGLKSRGMLEQRILELLKDDQVDAVGICGMGGVGKTTLAEEIKNKGAKDMFDEIFMVEISQEVNIERIQDHIAESIPLSLDSKHSTRYRAKMLYNALKKVKPKGNKNDQPTKILIIMDNIWKDLKLDQVGITLERTPQLCCKLLFTSRERGVCKSMGVPDKNIIDVSMLDKDESKCLFWEQITNVDDNKVEKSVQDRLLRSCEGLPLAIVTLAKYLNCEDLSTWHYFADELEKPISCRSDDVHHDAAYKIIEASYNNIVKEMKMWFLLACLYPSGLGIPVEDLMRYGIGLDLFKRADSLMDVVKQANRWTEKLVSSSLLLEDDNKYGGRKVKVHDVVRSYTILSAEKDGQKFMVDAIPGWHFDDSWKNYTAISLSNGKDCSRLKGMRFDMLEMLILKGNRQWPFKLDDHDDLFLGMARLKVLQLSRMESRLPKSITTLTHLRTLHLEYCILEDGDMEMVSELVGLVVLSLRGSDVKRLPYGFKNLTHLLLLDLNECRCLTTIPGNVLRSLTQLEGLYMVKSYESRWQDNSSEMEQGTTASVAEIRSLHCLKVLQIQVERIEQVTLSDMQFITSLQNFKFYAHRDDDERNMVMFSGVNFEVKIGYFSEWFWEYPCVKALLARSKQVEIKEISDNEGLVKNVVPNLDGQGFQILEELRLYNLNGLTKICDGQAPVRMFFNLQHLELKGLENLESYVVPIDVAPNLTTLSVSDCEKLKFLWLEHVTPFRQKERHVIYKLGCLKYLKLDYLPNLLQALGNDDNVTCSTSSDMNKPQALFNANKIVFPSLEELEIKGSSMYKKLVEWEISATPSPHFSPFPNLRKLYIEDAHNMKIGIGSPFIAATLVHLETLQISCCEKMKKVISEETEEETQISSNIIITFSKLHLLKLQSLEELECIYGGSYKVEFPNLKEMELTDVPNMTRFVGPENTVDFLPKKMLINLRCLILRKLEQLDSYVLLVDIAPNLTELYVCDCKKLKYIWMENVTEKERYEFPCLKFLRLKGLDNLIQALGNDNVNSCNKIQPLFNNKTVFPSLEELDVEGSSMYNKLVEWELSPTPTPHFFPFPNLKKLYINHAYNMETGIGSPFIASTLVHLETLQIRGCKKMKQVISEETEEETQILSNIIITFPKLNRLYLAGLEELECIYGGSYKVEFPALKKLQLLVVPNITRFVGPESSDNLLEKVEFPSLEEMVISHTARSMMNLYSPFRTLRVANLEGLKWKHAFSKDMVATIGLTQLHHLEQLYIRDCKNMEAVLEGIDDEAITSSSSFNLEFPRLTTIGLDGCDKMRWFFSTRHAHIILNMPSLQEVSIDYCNDMELFSNGTIKVPKLAQVNVTRFYEDEDEDEDKVYKMPDGGDLNKFIHDFCKFFHP